MRTLSDDLKNPLFLISRREVANRGTGAAAGDADGRFPRWRTGMGVRVIRFSRSAGVLVRAAMSRAEPGDRVPLGGGSIRSVAGPRGRSR